jgi:transposase
MPYLQGIDAPRHYQHTLILRNGGKSREISKFSFTPQPGHNQATTTPRPRHVHATSMTAKKTYVVQTLRDIHHAKSIITTAISTTQEKKNNSNSHQHTGTLFARQQDSHPHHQQQQQHALKLVYGCEKLATVGSRKIAGNWLGSPRKRPYLRNIMNNQQRAKTRSKMGLSRELQVTRDSNVPHPARGGTRGYPLWYRSLCVQMCQALNWNYAAVAAQPQIAPCEDTLRAWCETRLQPFEMTGGRQRTEIVGVDLLQMCIFLTAYPEAKADQIAMHIINNGGGIYDRPTISRRMTDLELSKKRGSTEAYQAFLPHNIVRLQRFFTMPPPVGVFGQLRQKYIDFDECGVSLDGTNPTIGHAHTSVRVRKPGFYTKDTKLTVICGVEPGDPTLPPHVTGSITRPRRWIRVNDFAGTNQVEFASFVDYVLTDIETNPVPNGNDDSRLLLWDNLAAHLTALVYQTVQGRPTPNVFEIVARPPYQPKYGPIEYIFCELGDELRRRSRPHWTINTLRQEIIQILSSIGHDGKLNNTFAHCGY